MARKGTDAGGVTRLLQQAANGDARAESELLRILYEDLRRIAQRHMRGERREHTLQPTALLNEAYVRLMRGARPEWRDRVHFLASASTVMRRILVDHARRRAAVKRGTPCADVDVAGLADSDGFHSPERVLAVDEALIALAGENARQARIVELRFFSGLGNDEVAAILGVSPRTVKREWTLAKGWLYRRLQSQP